MKSGCLDPVALAAGNVPDALRSQATAYTHIVSHPILNPTPDARVLDWNARPTTLLYSAHRRIDSLASCFYSAGSPFTSKPFSNHVLLLPHATQPGRVPPRPLGSDCYDGLSSSKVIQQLRLLGAELYGREHLEELLFCRLTSDLVGDALCDARPLTWLLPRICRSSSRSGPPERPESPWSALPEP
ncbi:hypothetical protein BDV93DRAFT_511549 [Ceratobasidium sp. AG-I]|nr:hypothetical protein BDV93DRAFT_511549 [Ceratobasidium sp. AG-I]